MRSGQKGGTKAGPAGAPGGHQRVPMMSPSLDPVPAYRGLGADNGIQAAAAAFDDRPGADVAVVADQQYLLDPGGPGHDQALPQDLRGVTTPAVAGQDAVADGFADLIIGVRLATAAEANQ
jgi:hypothetical protein